ncbi:MAG: adenosylcobinamide-GDP ribazoletransferase [Candidatus Omnitrophica bacterium]|nr:adenosylcobinamide-GDP ribazoletransferase [Candidatus Omnitrophota bacterium]MBU1869616.1 adenosylcobinamide-GDP ribazoletransferase [Candidatus Omnitrophota bacterium]
MKSLLAALQFLTIVPVKIKHIRENTVSYSLIFFPIIGLMIGGILTGAYLALLYFGFQQLSASIILVIFLILITGGMHLDGLSDTADAFMSNKNKEEMLKIMRDSHAGVMGVLSIVSAILLKIALLISINIYLLPIALILTCLLSRWAMVFLIFLFPYAREEGKAKSFTKGINLKIFATATLFALALSFLVWGFKGLLILIIISLFTYISGLLIKRKISGITGDTIGAVNEITEIAVLFCICFLQRSLL